MLGQFYFGHSEVSSIYPTYLWTWDNGSYSIEILRISNVSLLATWLNLVHLGYLLCAATICNVKPSAQRFFSDFSFSTTPQHRTKLAISAHSQYLAYSPRSMKWRLSENISVNDCRDIFGCRVDPHRFPLDWIAPISSSCMKNTSTLLRPFPYI